MNKLSADGKTTNIKAATTAAVREGVRSVHAPVVSQAIVEVLTDTFVRTRVPLK